MKLSTSLNLYNRVEKDYKKILYRAKECGFECFDFNPGDYVRDEDNFYTSPDWRKNLYDIKKYADELGVKFTQSHSFLFLKEDENTDYQIKKSIEASAVMEVPWTVMHPWKLEAVDKTENIEKNIEKIEPYAELAKSLGLGVCVENMPKLMYWFGEEVRWEAFFDAEDLIAVVDPLNERLGNMGVCWDTGHANLTVKSQYDDIVKLGDRLKVLHIADNSGQYDEHMPPFMGYVKWQEIMDALKKIEYKGTFNFETHRFTNELPDVLVDDAVKMMKKIGDYVIGL